MPYYARATADEYGGVAIVESDAGMVWATPGFPDVPSAMEAARTRAAEWNGRDLEIITRLLGLNQAAESAAELATDPEPDTESQPGA